MNLSSSLLPSAARKIWLSPKKIQDCEMLHLGPHENIRRAQFDLLRGDRSLHDLRGAEHGRKWRRSSSLWRPTPKRHVDGDHNVRKTEQADHRATGLQLRRRSAPHRRIGPDETIPEWPSSRPRPVLAAPSRTQPRCDRDNSSPQRWSRCRDPQNGLASGRPEQVKTNLGVQQHRIAATAEHEVSEASDSRPQKLAHDVGAVAQNAQYVGPNGPPLNSRRVGRADDSAHRRAGDRYGANPHFVQGFQRQDMRNSSRAAASERDRHPWPTNISECDRGFRPQRLLFAFASYRPPTNIASAKSLRPIDAIDGRVCSSLRFTDVAAERSNR